jgi:hypothetical protein
VSAYGDDKLRSCTTFRLSIELASIATGTDNLRLASIFIFSLALFPPVARRLYGDCGNPDDIATCVWKGIARL